MPFRNELTSVYTSARERLEDLERDPPVQAEMTPGGFATVVLSELGQAVRQHPAPGISQHLHICIVTLGTIGVAPHNYEIIARDGTRTEVRMPPVATSWPEFEQCCRDQRLTAAEACC
jgi:hypothetical protein